MVPIYPYLTLNMPLPKLPKDIFLVQNDKRIVYINNALRQAFKSSEFWGARGVLAYNRSLWLLSVGIVVVVIIPVKPVVKGLVHSVKSIQPVNIN